VPPASDAAATPLVRPPTVVDLSSLWAGPLAGALLAAVGARVTKVEAAGRPDSTATSAPAFDRRLNGAKRRERIDLADAKEADRLRAMLAGADIVITSARPRGLASAGLLAELERERERLWIAITAYGIGEDPMRVGFGDDCAFAGGLVDRAGDGSPLFIGDAVADPLTGMRAAAFALAALAGGSRGLLDIPLADTAALAAREADLA
jgi:crotonobetainyl-CoA:carnitine CoA-transferase CaiB-like acyl-CoA transferase